MRTPVRKDRGNSVGKGKAHRITWIGRASVAAVGLTAVAACGEQEAAQSNAVAADNDIFGGVRDDDASSRSAVVALRIKRANNYELCSGALIAPNVVITARHCVAQILTTSVTCDEDGKSKYGMQHFTGDEPAANIGVFLGAAPAFTKSPVAVGKSIVAPAGDVLCNADIAIVVLDRPVGDVTPFAMRLAANARIGESIRAVGYGANDAKTPMGTRFRREQVPVLAVGKGISKSSTRLGPNEFEVGKSICEGDSGGPAISELTGSVIGVVSRGGECGDDYGHVYTATAGFKDLFDRAFAEAGGAPVLEQNTPPENVEAEPKLSSSGGAGAGGPKDRAPPPSGCSAAPSPSGGNANATLLLGVAATLVLSRRSSKPRAR